MKNLHPKKWLIYLIGIFIFIVILLFAAPRIARWYIVKNSPELIGRKLDIKKIRLNYFSGTLRIYDLQLFEADSKTIFLSFQKLKINLDYLPLFRNEIFIRYISVDAPFVQVLQNGDKFNFDDLMASDTATAESDTLPGEPAKYTVNNIQITRGNVKYTDIIINHTIALRNVDLLIPGFTWNAGSTKMDVDFRFVDGGRLFSSLELNQADSTYSVNLKLDSLNLDIIEPYVKNNMYISALHGYLSNDILIKGNMQSIMQLYVHGVNHVYGLQLIDTLNRTILSCNDLTVDIDSLQFDKNRISLNYLGLKDPFMFIEMIDSTNNWLSLIKPTGGPPADSLQKQSDTTLATDEYSFKFTKMMMSGGRITLSDKTLRYPFDYKIDNLKMECTPLKNTPGEINIVTSAVLNGTGNLKVLATVNPQNINDMDLSLSVEQFRMKDVDAYFRHYFGFPVTGGRMNFSTENKLRSSSLVSSNSLYFRKFTLAKRTDDKREYNTPLRLALGVMSDKNGIIDLKAPVEMKGEEVKVGNIRKIIFRTIGNLFVKAAVSPVHLLADVFKVDPETLKEIHLGLTGPSPDEQNMKSVDLLAEILNKKPGLNIDLIYCINQQKLTDTLSYMMAIRDYINYSRSHGKNVNPVPDTAFSGYLVRKLSVDTLKEKINLLELCHRFAGVELLNAKIDSIKTTQTKFMLDYLSGDKMIPPERFKIIGTMPDTLRYDMVYPAFRVAFTAGEESPGQAD